MGNDTSTAEPGEYLFGMYWDDRNLLLNEELSSLRSILKKTERKYKSMESIVQQIEAFQEQERLLNSRLDVVKSILNTQINPMNVMIYISKNIPKDLWLSELGLEGRQLTIKGQSCSRPSFGRITNEIRV